MSGTSTSSPSSDWPTTLSSSAGNSNGGQYPSPNYSSFLFDSFPVGLYWATLDGKIVKANPALANLLGYPDCSMLSSITITDLYLHPENRGDELALLERPGDLCVSEVQLQHHNGPTIWVLNTLRVIQGADDQTLYHLGVVEDITHYRQVIETLQESNRQLESRERFITHILQSVPSSLVVVDRALHIVSVNRNFLNKTHRDEQATLGRSLEEVFPQVLVEYTRLDQKARDVFRTNQTVEGKVAYRAPGLSKRIYYYRLIPFKEAGAIENVTLLMDDITEREQLEEEVWRAERHLASVVDCANDLVISMNPEGYILTWNQAAERVSGLSSELATGHLNK